MSGIARQFGGVAALAGADLAVAGGEVHALLGENGAGKSTLMRILAGAIRPDAGAMTLDERPFRPSSPVEARAAGIVMIHQELAIAAHCSIDENLVLGRERTGSLERARTALRSLGVSRDGRTLAGRLAPSERQLVEIARAMGDEARVVVLDEPTSSLGPSEVTRVFEAMRLLRSRGCAVIFISHHLDEVRRVADRYTILRDGRTVASGRVDGESDDELIAAMAGRPIQQVFPPRGRTPGAAVLSVEHLGGTTRPIDASLTLRRGEILGVAGLVGSGRTEFLRVIAGLDPMCRGSIRVGDTRDRGATSAQRIAQGVGLLSEDRCNEGLAGQLSIAINLLLPSLRPSARRGLLSLRSLDARATRAMQALGTRARSAQQRVAELSGGNQQKIALARLLERDVDVLLLDEPTRGIDVASKAEIYRLLDQLARAGKAILVVSSTTSELLGLCDRLAVMVDGRLGDARPIDAWDEASVLRESSLRDGRAA